MRKLAGHVAAGAVVLFVVIAGCGKDEKAAPVTREVKVVAAVTRDVPIEREWVGETMGAVDVEIRARIDGWLTGIEFKDGSRVTKGQLLYSIDPTEREQSVAEAKGRLASSQTLFARAKSDVDRYKPLAASGAVSKRDLERAEAEYGARKGEVEAAGASLRIAEVNLGYARIYSPIDGLIGISRARVGDYVGKPPNPVLLNTVSQIDSIHVRFSVTEAQYLEFARRSPAKDSSRAKIELSLALADGSEYPLKGFALYTQREVDAATGTLRIEASFPNPKMILRPGQFARVKAVVDTRKNAVIVPAKALIELQGQFQLYVVGSDNKTQLRSVTIATRTASLAVIEKGVSAGEQVIVEGVQLVRPDMQVAATLIPIDSVVTTEKKSGGN
jgi:membrane fusion protein (multidrug efflux system)